MLVPPVAPPLSPHGNALPVQALWHARLSLPQRTRRVLELLENLDEAALDRKASDGVDERVALWWMARALDETQVRNALTSPGPRRRVQPGPALAALPALLARSNEGTGLTPWMMGRACLFMAWDMVGPSPLQPHPWEPWPDMAFPAGQVVDMVDALVAHAAAAAGNSQAKGLGGDLVAAFHDLERHVRHEPETARRAPRQRLLAACLDLARFPSDPTLMNWEAAAIMLEGGGEVPLGQRTALASLFGLIRALLDTGARPTLEQIDAWSHHPCHAGIHTLLMERMLDESWAPATGPSRPRF